METVGAIVGSLIGALVGSGLIIWNEHVKQDREEDTQREKMEIWKVLDQGILGSVDEISEKTNLSKVEAEALTYQMIQEGTLDLDPLADRFKRRLARPND